MPSIVKVISPEYYHHESLLIECSWILSNMATGDNQVVAYLIEFGAVHNVLELMRHPCNEVKENAVMFLAYFAGGPIAERDMLLNEGVVDKIEWLLQSTKPQAAITSSVAWLISNLTRGRPDPEKVSFLDVNYG